MSLIDIVLTEEQQEGTTSTLQRWLKQPGETVRAHEPVAELETDKVVMELAAPTSGTVSTTARSTSTSSGRIASRSRTPPTGSWKRRT